MASQKKFAEEHLNEDLEQKVEEVRKYAKDAKVFSMENITYVNFKTHEYQPDKTKRQEHSTTRLNESTSLSKVLIIDDSIFVQKLLKPLKGTSNSNHSFKHPKIGNNSKHPEVFKNL